MKAKRRRFGPTLKAKIGLEALKGIKTVAEIAREYQVHPNQVSQWKGEVAQRLGELRGSESARAPQPERN
jgi:transposase-like protein